MELLLLNLFEGNVDFWIHSGWCLGRPHNSTRIALQFLLNIPVLGRGVNYASPTSGEAYRDRRLTTNFELWVEIFCVSTCFHVRIPKPCLSVRPSVCPHPEKRNPLSFANISPTLVIDASMERFSRVLHNGNPKKIEFFSKKVRNSKFDFWWRAEITLASSISVLH